MQRSGHSLLGRTDPQVENLSERVLQEHFVSQLDSMPVKPKPRGGICRVCKLPLDSKTATVHAKCKKSQAEDISKIHERMYESSHRRHETYEAKQSLKQQEEEEVHNERLAVAKKRHRGRKVDAETLPDGTEVSGAEAFAARQARLEAERTKKIEAKQQKTEEVDLEATFQPVISSHSLKLLGASQADGSPKLRSGDVAERLHEGEARRQERLDAKTKAMHEKEVAMFKPVISAGSAAMMDGQNRSGNAYVLPHLNPHPILTQSSSSSYHPHLVRV